MTDPFAKFWKPVATAPSDEWIKTKREGERGENICFRRSGRLNGNDEWIDKQGRTTITHTTFAPPTHWRFLVEESDI